MAGLGEHAMPRNKIPSLIKYLDWRPIRKRDDRRGYGLFNISLYYFGSSQHLFGRNHKFINHSLGSLTSSGVSQTAVFGRVLRAVSSHSFPALSFCGQRWTTTPARTHPAIRLALPEPRVQITVTRSNPKRSTSAIPSQV